MRRAAMVGLAVVGSLLFIVVVIAAAALADARAHEGKVLRNTVVAGRPVGGLTAAAATVAAEELASAVEAAQVVVSAPGGGLRTSARELRVRVDRATLRRRMLQSGRTGPAFGRILGWARALLQPRQVELPVRVDESAAWRVVAAGDDDRVPPVEPGLVVHDGELVARPGRRGRGIDPRHVAAAVATAASHGPSLRVEVGRGRVEPRFSRRDAAALAEQANALTTRRVLATSGASTVTLGPRSLRPWVVARATDAGLVAKLDPSRTIDGLRLLLPTAGEPAVDASFEIADGAVRVVPGRTGTRCCTRAAALLIEDALRKGSGARARLALTTAEPERSVADALALGVREKVGAFTTKHKPRQPRVSNIHRIADLVRGQVIEPGRSFSVNGFVGNRTVEKGFVVDHVIEDGKFTEAVGGGISQFATTTFNAAFFAGLDFGEYQSHSIYIRRYPYGREATLSFPHPDLVIRNTTPYGVVIWPTYTETTITIDLWSTRHIDVKQTAQTRSPTGVCTRVRTERTRTWPDGRTKVDNVYAVYRPEEGVNCR